jgi:hypothetical protein
MILNEKEYAPDIKSKSPYFDLKHYAFNEDNVVNWAKANDRIVELSLENLVSLAGYREVSQQIIDKLGEPMRPGSESIPLQKDDKVYKIIFDNGFDIGPWAIAYNKLTKHNRVFPETAYKVAYVVHCPWEKRKEELFSGPVRDTEHRMIRLHLKLLERSATIPKSGYWPVLCQDILETEMPESVYNSGNAKYCCDGTMVEKFLADKGFQQISYPSDPGKRTFKKGKTYVGDVRRDNYGWDKEGNVRIFDAIISNDYKDFCELLGISENG